MTDNHDADTALVSLSEPGLSVTRAPDIVLEEAHTAAAALKRVIDAKPKKVLFGGEQYLEYEDWQTVGRFYGIAPRIVTTRFVQYDDYGDKAVSGWEATAEAVHVPSQRVVSTAEAMCLNDEEKWSTRPKYALVYVKKSGGYSVEDPGKDELIWEPGPNGKNRPKKERRLVGEERVPLFQLRSMAQTRAAAKALRNALAWVVVLAGYRPTPAEEIDSGPSGDVVEAGDGPAPEREGEAPPEDTEALRSILLDKINHFRTKKKISEGVFEGICAKYRVAVADLGKTNAKQLNDILNAVAQWRAPDSDKV